MPPHWLNASSTHHINNNKHGTKGLHQFEPPLHCLGLFCFALPYRRLPTMIAGDRLHGLCHDSKLRCHELYDTPMIYLWYTYDIPMTYLWYIYDAALAFLLLPWRFVHPHAGLYVSLTEFKSEFHQLELSHLGSKVQSSMNLNSKFNRSIVHALSNQNSTTRVQG